MVSAMTPTATPAIEMNVISETKVCLRFALR
jgi:hypothetical protein